MLANITKPWPQYKLKPLPKVKVKVKVKVKTTAARGSGPKPGKPSSAQYRLRKLGHSFLLWHGFRWPGTKTREIKGENREKLGACLEESHRQQNSRIAGK